MQKNENKIQQLVGIVALLNAQASKLDVKLGVSSNRGELSGSVSFELVERERAYYSPEDFAAASHDVWLNFHADNGEVHGLDGMPSSESLEEIVVWATFKMSGELRRMKNKIDALREELDNEQAENSTFRDENAELDTLREALDAERLFKQKVLQGVIEECNMLRKALDKVPAENPIFRDENVEPSIGTTLYIDGLREERDMLADENAKMAKFLKENGSWAHKELTDDDVDDIATTGDLRK